MSSAVSAAESSAVRKPSAVKKSSASVGREASLTRNITVEKERSSQEGGALVKVNFVTIDEDTAGQRIDNYLLRILKGVPKTRVYRIVRKGEVRVNKKRVTADYRLQSGDVVRICLLYTSRCV